MFVELCVCVCLFKEHVQKEMKETKEIKEMKESRLEPTLYPGNFKKVHLSKD